MFVGDCWGGQSLHEPSFLVVPQGHAQSRELRLLNEFCDMKLRTLCLASGLYLSFVILYQDGNRLFSFSLSRIHFIFVGKMQLSSNNNDDK